MTVGKVFASVLFCISLASLSHAGDPNDFQIKVIDRYIAIDNVCAWPNIQLLKDGTILAMVYSEPNHGFSEGDIQCWASTDSGRNWKLRSIAAKHEKDTNRMNIAAGLANNGDVIVLSSGWSHKPKRNSYPLPVMVCRSSNAGRSWKTTKSAFKLPPTHSVVVPYGDIVRLSTNRLAACVYRPGQKDDTRFSRKRLDFKEIHDLNEDSSWLIFSDDDGRTWGSEIFLIGRHCNETAILKVDAVNWLAAARTAQSRVAFLKLFTSSDNGNSWQFSQPVSDACQHPAHLLKLNDDRILLTFGSRKTQKGIEVRISPDNGKTWLPTHELVALSGAGDCGYPSTVQLKDGTLVTAYYADKIYSHSRYHMGIIRWKLSPK